MRRVGDELPPGAVELRELHPHAVELRASSATSSCPSSTTGALEVTSRDAIGRDLESPDPPCELERGQGADEPRRGQGHAAEEEEIPANDVDRRQPVRERRRDEEDVVLADRPCATSANSRPSRCVRPCAGAFDAGGREGHLVVDEIRRGQ